jgi:hypothetical protein
LVGQSPAKQRIEVDAGRLNDMQALHADARRVQAAGDGGHDQALPAREEDAGEHHVGQVQKGRGGFQAPQEVHDHGEDQEIRDDLGPQVPDRPSAERVPDDQSRVAEKTEIRQQQKCGGEKRPVHLGAQPQAVQQIGKGNPHEAECARQSPPEPRTRAHCR